VFNANFTHKGDAMKSNILIVVLGVLLFLPSFAQVGEASQVPKVSVQKLQQPGAVIRRQTATPGEGAGRFESIRPKTVPVTRVPVDNIASTYFQSMQPERSTDGDGDGLNNAMDYCLNTPSVFYVLEASPYENEEDKVSIPNSLTGTPIKAHLHSINSEGEAFINFDNLTGFGPNGYPCSYEIDHTVGMSFAINERRQIPCTNLFARAIYIAPNEDEVYLQVQKMVMIPIEWLSDNQPINEQYRRSSVVYHYPGTQWQGADQMGIPIGCHIDFPLSPWSGTTNGPGQLPVVE
jgi:hypothetical protein